RDLQSFPTRRSSDLFTKFSPFYLCRISVSYVELTLNIKTLNYEGLKPVLNKQDDKIYVINFWATWCIPCVKELPAFERLREEYYDKSVEVILISLDLSSQKDNVVVPFLKRKRIKSPVFIFNDSNEQFWIEDISKDWTGSIPSTLIYNKKQRIFYERTFNYKQLNEVLQAFIN
ncbi:MAG TPA: hypothetical protein DDY16_08295, partial [Tenacibaculum sp.]|nr:hypothetical protein [Tenacibaculum sp.]